MNKPRLNRRQFLKVSTGAAFSLVVVSKTALLTGCSPAVPGTSFKVLRETDLPLLKALFPAMIGRHPELASESQSETLPEVVNALDHMLAHSSVRMQQEVYQLFDLLTFPVTRASLAGVWTAWENVTPRQAEQFLLRWRDSRIRLLRFGYQGLNQLLLMSWYGLPRSWAFTGYGGPPDISGMSNV